MIVPNTLEACVIDSILTLSVSLLFKLSISNVPSSFTEIYSNIAPVRLVMTCHGTIFEWCSISLINTISFFLRLEKPQESATRLIDSVAPLVNIIDELCFDPINFATLFLVPSKALVAFSPNS